MLFEEPLLVKNLSFGHLLVYMYTSPNMSFLFKAEYCPTLMLSGYKIIDT